MDSQQIEQLLTPKFPKKHVVAAINHFAAMTTNVQTGNWEPGIAKAGKFVEAVSKALCACAKLTFSGGRQFKVGAVIAQLEKQPATIDDTIRLTIPRACRFAYDIASNRGARHDPDEIDPNEMDANVVVSTCSWILSEMIRYAQKGAVGTDEAVAIVESLSTKRYPLVEEVDGRVYFHHADASATNVALMALAHRSPRRMPKNELMDTLRNHHFKRRNCEVAIQRIARFVDDDGKGNLRLLAPGLKKAEELMAG
jgi:hypothetical protein